MNQNVLLCVIMLASFGQKIAASRPSAYEGVSEGRVEPKVAAPGYLERQREIRAAVREADKFDSRSLEAVAAAVAGATEQRLDVIEQITEANPFNRTLMPLQSCKIVQNSVKGLCLHKKELNRVMNQLLTLFEYHVMNTNLELGQELILMDTDPKYSNPSTSQEAFKERYPLLLGGVGCKEESTIKAQFTNGRSVTLTYFPQGLVTLMVDGPLLIPTETLRAAASVVPRYDSDDFD